MAASRQQLCLSHCNAYKGLAFIQLGIQQKETQPNQSLSQSDDTFRNPLLLNWSSWVRGNACWGQVNFSAEKCLPCQAGSLAKTFPSVHTHAHTGARTHTAVTLTPDMSPVASRRTGFHMQRPVPPVLAWHICDHITRSIATLSPACLHKKYLRIFSRIRHILFNLFFFFFLYLLFLYFQPD